MKLLEYESKEIFKEKGIPVPRSGGVIKTTAGLAGALKKAGRGPWVLKAQVLAGGRGKAGGIKLVKNAKEARETAKAMIGMTMATHQTHGQALKVREVLVESGADIKKEYYLAMAMDRTVSSPTVIASSEGGVEIEKLADERPEALLRQPFCANTGLRDFEARKLAFRLGIAAEHAGGFCRVAKTLSRIFIDYDCSLVEINPLVITPQGWVALDAKLVTDDNALFRHKAIAAKTDHEATPLEREATKVGITYIGLDGSIGCLVNGAGLAMSTMDTILLAGGSPANFLDVGGGANAEQVERAFKIILKDRNVKAVLVNIFGGIMKCDTIAEGILSALKSVKMDVPLVVRLEGTRVKEGKDILQRSGVKLQSADSLWDAAQAAVQAAR